jgi:hypothetical protein
MVPANVRIVVNALVSIATLVFAGKMIHRGLKTDEWLPDGAALLWANLALWILLPLDALAYVWLFVPIFYHATQHWGAAWITQQKESGIKPINFTQWASETLRLVLPVQVVSLTVLFFPLLAFGAVNQDATLPVVWSMLVFYLHYFADRVVWREGTKTKPIRLSWGLRLKQWTVYRGLF